MLGLGVTVFSLATVVCRAVQCSSATHALTIGPQHQVQARPWADGHGARVRLCRCGLRQAAGYE